jgi:hypothetical protein
LRIVRRDLGLRNGDSSEVYARLKERNIPFVTYSGHDDLVDPKKRLASRQLRGAVDDGSIVQHVSWRAVLPGDVVFVPAATIHAIGGIAGFVAYMGVGVPVPQLLDTPTSLTPTKAAPVNGHVGTTQ